MRGELPRVTMAKVRGLVDIVVPDSPYRMWLQGTLGEFLHVPDGSRVEIIDGEVVVSPAPVFRHARTIQAITREFERKLLLDASYRWRCYQSAGLNFIAESNGYIPDLIVMDADTDDEAWTSSAAYLLPDQIELVVEATSCSNARQDRANESKWSAYARAEIPYYLLIDMDPKVARTTLYSIPEQASAAYLHQESWGFGETVELPDPFGLRIPTDAWKAWD